MQPPMFSIDDAFRIRAGVGAVANEASRAEGELSSTPKYRDPEVLARKLPGTCSDAMGAAFAHRLADFQEGRRLGNAAHVSVVNSHGAAPTVSTGIRLYSDPQASSAKPPSDAGLPDPAESLQRLKRGDRNGFRALTAEDDEGDVEYKWRLTDISALRFEHLVTQMKFRVTEGRGQCLYQLGVADNGVLRGLPAAEFAESVETIQRMARTLGFDCAILQECVVQREPHLLYCGELLVSRRHARGQDVSLCFCGALGAGKSTLMGALLTATLDDGKGSTRQTLFNHKHEVDSGRTSSIATRVWTVSDEATSPARGLGKETWSTTEVDELGSEVEVSLVVDPCDGGKEEDTDSIDLHSNANAEEESTSNRETVGPADGSRECLARSFSSDGVAPLLSLSPGGQERAGARTPPALMRGTCGEGLGQQTDGQGGPCCGPPRGRKKESRKRTRLISLMDVGGDITKTSLFGLMSRKPDYVCLCIAADGAADSVSLYAQVSCAIGTPFLVAVTKTDTVEDFELDSFCMEVEATLRNGVGCACDVVEDEATALAYCQTHLPRHRDGGVDGGFESTPRFVKQPPRVPIFCVSSVSGNGLELLKFTIARLPRPVVPVPMTPLSASTRPSFEVLLDYAFSVDGVGPVVRGRVGSGTVEVGCAGYMGPDETGAFYPVVLRGIHVDGAHVNEAQTGDEATFALDRLPPSVDVAHKGKVLVRQPKSAASAFRLTVRVLSQSLTAHLEPILYSRNARQAIRILTCNPRSPVLRPPPPPVPRRARGPSSTALPDGLAGVALFPTESTPSSVSAVREEEFEVECEFLFRPEVLTYDASVVLRWEPKGIAVGRVSRLGPSHR